MAIQKRDKEFTFILGFVFFLYIFYIHSGICPSTDDWDLIIQFKDGFLANLIAPPDFITRNPLTVFFYPLLYKLGYSFNAYWMFRTIAFSILFFLIYFICNQITKSKVVALTFPLLSLFFPNHDSMIFWNIIYVYNISIILSIGWIIACKYALDKNNLFILIFFGLSLVLLSFSYIIPPIICAAISVMIFLWIKTKNRKYLKAALLTFFALFIFSFYYYFICNYFFGYSTNAKIASFSLMFVLKNFVIQFFSNIDATMGPSLIFKWYFSIKEIANSPIDIIISIIISGIIIANLYIDKKKPDVKPTLLVAFLSCYIFTLAIYAATGRYTQIAFGLGNRVTFLPTFGIVGIFLYFFCKGGLNSQKKIILSFLITLCVFSTTGLSRHWKNTSEWLLDTGERTKLILEKNSIPENSLIVIDGHIYSNLGQFSHLEIFSLESNANSFFYYATGKNNEWIPALSYYKVENNLLIDGKFDVRRDLSERKLFYYNIPDKKIKRVEIEDLNRIFQSSKNRWKKHWIFLFKNTPLEYLAVKINPKFSIYFDL